MSQALTTTDLQGALPLIARGKVRDLYEIDDKTLLFVASDRISAYDVIMENVGPPQPNSNYSTSMLILNCYRESQIRVSSSLSARKHGSRP